MKYRKINNIFFVGIGGIGMSGIAELLHEQGFNVSGSDIYENENVKRLKRLGIKVSIGHSPKNISKIDLLVYSSAVPKRILKFLRQSKNQFQLFGEQRC